MFIRKHLTLGSNVCGPAIDICQQYQYICSHTFLISLKIVIFITFSRISSSKNIFKNVFKNTVSVSFTHLCANIDVKFKQVDLVFIYIVVYKLEWTTQHNYCISSFSRVNCKIYTIMILYARHTSLYIYKLWRAHFLGS